MVTTNAPIITLRDVRFTYDGGATWALDGVSLDIRRGERICLTGPNGSGQIHAVTCHRRTGGSR